MIREALTSDQTAMAALYARNHPEASTPFRFEIDPKGHGFVALDSSGAVIGFALVLHIDHGAESFGVITQLHIARTYLPPDRHAVRDALVGACITWLQEHGVELVYARTADKGTDLAAMLRFTRDREWRLDPDRDDSPKQAEPRSGPAAPPIQSPPSVWN